MTGILPNDMIPPSVPAGSSCLDPTEPVAVAIEQHGKRQAAEHDRAELNRSISETLHSFVRLEIDRSYGSDLTRKAYRSDFAKFVNFCREQNLVALPTTCEAVAFFILYRAAEGGRPKQLERTVSAIKFFHAWADKSLGCDETLVRAALAFARSHYDEAQQEKAASEKDKPADKSNGKEADGH